MINLISKYNFTLSWDYENIKVYNNDDMCLYLSTSKSGATVRVDYRDTFDRWSVALYQRSFDLLDETAIGEVSVVIDTLIENKDKAIIEFVDESGFKGYELNYDYLKCLKMEGI